MFAAVKGRWVASALQVRVVLGLITCGFLSMLISVPLINGA